MVFLTSHASFNIWFCLFPDFTCMKEWTILTFHQTPLEIKWMGSKRLSQPLSSMNSGGSVARGQRVRKENPGSNPMSYQAKEEPRIPPHKPRLAETPTSPFFKPREQNWLRSDRTTGRIGWRPLREGKGRLICLPDFPVLGTKLVNFGESLLLRQSNKLYLCIYPSPCLCMYILTDKWRVCCYYRYLCDLYYPQ